MVDQEKTLRDQTRSEQPVKNKAGNGLRIRSRFVVSLKSPAFCLFMFFAFFYYFTNGGEYLSGDQFHLRNVAANIVDNGRLGFEIEGSLPDEMTGDFFKGESGLYYTKWGLGQSLVEVPFYFLHRLFWQRSVSTEKEQDRSGAFKVSETAFVFLAPALISAIGCALVFGLGLLMGFTVKNSILLSLLYGLSTIVWPYSKFLFSETTLNVAILGGVYATVRYVTKSQRWILAISGACMGFAFMTKVISVLVVPIVILYLLASCGVRRGVRDTGLFFSPAFLVFVFIQLWHNEIRYGNMLEFGYSASWDRLGFSNPMLTGLWGLLLSPGKSFFLYSPVTILGALGLPRFFQRKKKEVFLFLGTCVVILVPHACWWSWSGDWAWGPRFLVPITPYLIVASGFFFASSPVGTRLKRAFVISLIAISIFIQVLGVVINPHTFLEMRSVVVAGTVNPEGGTGAPMLFDVAFSNFIPMFSHLTGNWWLFKHMLHTYDLGSDAPWKAMKDFQMPAPIAIEGERVYPFWWVSTFPCLAPSSGHWVRLLAAVNFLTVLWFGLRVRQFLRNPKKELAVKVASSSKDALPQQEDR
jgi:hypothetical protein